MMIKCQGQNFISTLTKNENEKSFGMILFVFFLIGLFCWCLHLHLCFCFRACVCVYSLFVFRKTRPKTNRLNHHESDDFVKINCKYVSIWMCIVLSCAWLFSLSYILAIVHTEFKELNIDMKKCKYHTFIFTKCTIKKHKDRYIPYLFIVVTKKIPFYKRNKSKRKGNICVRMQTVNKCFINVYKVINKI